MAQVSSRSGRKSAEFCPWARPTRWRRRNAPGAACWLRIVRSDGRCRHGRAVRGPAGGPAGSREHRKVDGVAVGTCQAVDAPRLGERLEQLPRVRQCFGLAQEQVAADVQGETEEGDNFLLGLRLEVDEHVAAGDQVHLREWGVGDQVLTRKDDRFAELLGDLVAIVLPREETFQPFGGDICGNAIQVHAGAGGLQGGLVHIGGEHLNGVASCRPRPAPPIT